MRLAVFVLIAMLAGCVASRPEAPGGAFQPTRFCGREYAGDLTNSSVIGVFKCESGYRLVFESPGHEEYYLDAGGSYHSSCPEKDANEECKKLLKGCSFVNLCRS
jgi:hypothetical protein